MVTPDKVRKWNLLERIATEIPNYPIDVSLLIDANSIKALKPLAFIPSRHGGPYAYKTALDWCIVGTTETSKSEKN